MRRDAHLPFDAGAELPIEFNRGRDGARELQAIHHWTVGVL